MPGRGPWSWVQRIVKVGTRSYGLGGPLAMGETSLPKATFLGDLVREHLEGLTTSRAWLQSLSFVQGTFSLRQARRLAGGWVRSE